MAVVACPRVCGTRFRDCISFNCADTLGACAFCSAGAGRVEYVARVICVGNAASSATVVVRTELRVTPAENTVRVDSLITLPGHTVLPKTAEPTLPITASKAVSRLADETIHAKADP